MATRAEQRAALLEYVHAQRGVDFSEYKDATLERRLKKRLQATGSSDYGEYLDVLQASPDEFEPLLGTLFINVTSFFRDDEPWGILRGHLESTLDLSSDEPIRVWSAGVASGEEGYTVAMLLAEILGPDAFRERVKIYATDVDEDELVRARQSQYTEEQVESVPPHLRERYLEGDGDRYGFRPDLRRALIFGRHDLLQDAPISRLDLLMCRNTLMYFNREAQDRILARFHFALKPTGLLFLGKAEMMLSRRHIFEPVDGSARIFRKVDHLSLQDRLGMISRRPDIGGNGERPALHVRLRELAQETSPVAQIIVDAEGSLSLANEAARAELGLSQQDIGRPFGDLEVSYRPVELRSRIHHVRETRERTRLDAVSQHTSSGDPRRYDIELRPLVDEDEGVVATSVTFTDVTRIHELNVEIERSRNELETAYEELQSTNEELETTNEELQSTIEELETTNEELQSTNQELETMNEELQSTSEEMGAVNDELGERNHALARLNAYMRSILDNVRAGIVVLDEASRVQMWNERSERLWGLRRDEVNGQSFLALDMGLPVEQLAQEIRACLRGDGKVAEKVLEAHDRRGRPLRCRVTCSPLLGPEGAANGTILLMEDSESTEGPDHR